MPTNKVIDAEYGIDIWKKYHSVPSKNVATSIGRTPKKSSKKPIIYLNPSDHEAFKNELMKKKQAEIIWKYSDGTEQRKHWNARKFSLNSSVRGNIQSKTEWRSKDKDGLVEVHVRIIEK